MRARLGTLLAVFAASITQSTAQCPTAIKELQCCQETNTRSQNPSLDALLTLLGFPPSSVGPNVSVGVTCTPISSVGIGSGSTCTATLNCCDGPSVGNGIVVIGCTPVTVIG